VLFRDKHFVKNRRESLPLLPVREGQGKRSTLTFLSRKELLNAIRANKRGKAEMSGGTPGTKSASGGAVIEVFLRCLAEQTCHTAPS